MSYRERYEAYLKTPEWGAKRKQKAEEQNYTCERCGERILKGFHIHHKTYKRFGREPLKDLQFLCEYCHSIVHIELDIKEKKKKIRKKLKLVQIVIIHKL